MASSDLIKLKADLKKELIDYYGEIQKEIDIRAQTLINDLEKKDSNHDNNKKTFLLKMNLEMIDTVEKICNDNMNQINEYFLKLSTKNQNGQLIKGDLNDLKYQIFENFCLYVKNDDLKNELRDKNILGILVTADWYLNIQKELEFIKRKLNFSPKIRHYQEIGQLKKLDFNLNENLTNLIYALSDFNPSYDKWNENMIIFTNGIIQLKKDQIKNQLNNFKSVQIHRNTFYDIKMIEQKALINFKNLIELDINYNRFSSSQIEVENGFLIGLDNLKILKMSSLLIKVIDSSSFQNLFKLEELKISFSFIDSIQDNSFLDQTNLTSLELKSNSIKLIKEKAFYRLNCLEYLNLTKTTVLVIESCEILSYLTSLKELNVNGTKILECIQDSIKTKSLIEYFISNFDKINYKDLKILIDQDNKLLSDSEISFSHLENLKVFRNNRMTLKLEENTYRVFPNLKRLNLKIDSKIDGNGSHLSIHSFNNCKILYENLEELDLNENWICFIEPKSFMSLCNLKILKLSRNGIRSIEAYTFSGLFKLEVLDLNENCISSIEQDCFNDFKKSLIKLNLNDNSIIFENNEEFKLKHDLTNTIIIF